MMIVDGKLKAMVDEAVELDREIEEKTARLNELKKLFKLEAENRPEQHTETDGGGWSWEIVGLSGCLVRVIAPANKLKSKIDPDTKGFDKIKKLAGNFLNILFIPVTVYKPASDFRNVAVNILGNAIGKKLIKACESESQMSVNFETKKPEKIAV